MLDFKIKFFKTIYCKVGRIITIETDWSLNVNLASKVPRTYTFIQWKTEWTTRKR